MVTISLVGCSDPVRSSAGPAYLLCRGSSGFAEAWERAAHDAQVVLILSPDYGLLHPDEELRPGDDGLGDERWQRDKERWMTRIRREIAALRWLEVRNQWIVLADGEWADRVADFLATHDQDVARRSPTAPETRT